MSAEFRPINIADLPARSENLSGRRFGSWQVQSPGRGRRQRLMWLCRCDCGTVRAVIHDSLLGGGSRGCGHIRASKTRHPSGNDVRLYRIWRAMRLRCNPDSEYPDHAHYRRLGIRVGDEWADFDCFADWAVANGYADDLTIDRIENLKGYEPSNCRWADDETQRWNRRALVMIDIDGEPVPFARAVRDAGLNYKRAYHLLRKGLSFAEIVSAMAVGL